MAGGALTLAVWGGREHTITYCHWGCIWSKGKDRCIRKHYYVYSAIQHILSWCIYVYLCNVVCTLAGWDLLFPQLHLLVGGGQRMDLVSVLLLVHLSSDPRRRTHVPRRPIRVSDGLQSVFQVLGHVPLMVLLPLLCYFAIWLYWLGRKRRKEWLVAGRRGIKEEGEEGKVGEEG